MKRDELGFYEEETYSKGLSREDTIEQQVRLCMYFYSRGFFKEFQYSLRMLIALLPKEVRNKFEILDHDTSTASKIDIHFNQFIDIQEALEVDTNMVFKRKFVKTFK